ncbi:MAG: UMP kinase [Proteobacteria bacterium]|nr:UMP kinase [Pseudomonadota bacterium]MBU2567488.1 UMP kinase [Elusimicrobiota bacterium]
MIKYRRVLIKISGEALAGKKGWGIDPAVLKSVADEIVSAKKTGACVSVVVGGGNFWRGREERIAGLDRGTSDYIGMLATVINACVLRDEISRIYPRVVVQSAIEVKELCDPIRKREAMDALSRNAIVIFAGGTGSPYFTTDTAAALRAAEVSAGCLIKATKVDGVYTDDPVKNRKARKFDRLASMEAIKRNLKIMDISAFSLCMENGIDIIVCSLKKGNLVKAIRGKKTGTLIVNRVSASAGH